MKSTRLLLITAIACLSFFSIAQRTELSTGGVYIAPYQENGELIQDSLYILKSTGCSTTSEGTIGLVDCADIGTPAFSTAGVTGSFDSEAGNTNPGPPCGPGGNALNNGSWHTYDLATGVNQVSVDYSGGFAGAGGFSEMWMSFYQGVDCSALTNVGCGQIIDKSGPNLVLLELSATGLDPTLPLYVFTWGNKAYTADFTLTGLPAPPVNDNCAGATSNGSGCNLGSSGAAFTPPSAALGAGACNGGTWYSNENTVFYTFTATSTSGSIEINNLTCNDGAGGEAQVGVWTNCAGVGTYGADYLGCAVGTGTVLLPSLNIGDSYIIAVDGQAGDACNWDFVTTGVFLPVELADFSANQFEEYTQINWMTLSESNSSHFSLERSDDGKEFTSVYTAAAGGNSQESIKYDFNDYTRTNSDVVYYRLRQVDIDGEEEFHGPIAVYPKKQEWTLAPNPVKDNLTVTFDGSSSVVSYSIINPSGQELLSGIRSNGDTRQFQINVEDLEPGIYYIQCFKNSTVYREAFLVE